MSRAVPCCSRQGQCVTLERIVKITSVTSSLASLAVLTIVLIWIISDLTWINLIQTIAAWIVEQKWDPTISRSVLVMLAQVETQPSLLLSLLALATLSHLAASVLLFLGVRLARRKFLLPWLVTHMVIVIIMTTIFTVWTFITFFIDLLVSVVFPVLSGLVLGLSILAWRLVLAAYRNNMISSLKRKDCDSDSLARGESEAELLSEITNHCLSSSCGGDVPLCHSHGIIIILALSTILIIPHPPSAQTHL